MMGVEKKCRVELLGVANVPKKHEGIEKVGRVAFHVARFNAVPCESNNLHRKPFRQTTMKCNSRCQGGEAKIHGFFQLLWQMWHSNVVQDNIEKSNKICFTSLYITTWWDRRAKEEVSAKNLGRLWQRVIAWFFFFRGFFSLAVPD